MQSNNDLIELLGALNGAGARYLVIGSYALAFHGYPRATKDADIFVGTDPDNARKVWKALLEFGAPLSALTPDDLTKPDTFFVMGRAPNQIDIITTIDGVSFEDAWNSRVAVSYGNVKTFILSRSEPGQ